MPVIEVSSDQEALEITNGSPFGLTAAVFTENLERGLAFAEATRAGWVNINASTNLWESHLPFGGRSGSLSGRGPRRRPLVVRSFHRAEDGPFSAPRRHPKAANTEFNGASRRIFGGGRRLSSERK